jgi:hypothetical protein
MPMVERFGQMTADLLGLLIVFAQGYTLGLMFLIAGYFIVGSYERKGFAPFMKERFLRLGVPALITMLIITPFINKVLFNFSVFDDSPDFFTVINWIFDGVGVMWFVEALLLFSLVYGLTQLRPFKKRIKAVTKPVKITLIHEIGLILIIALFAFALRLWSPMDRFVFGMRLGNFSAYILLFAVGIRLRKNDLLSTLSYRHGMRWLVAGIVLGICSGAAMFIIGGGTVSFNMFGVRLVGIETFEGGLTWQSAIFALWEAFIVVSMSIGLLARFKEKYNGQTRLSKTLSDNAFSVYMFHLPVIMTVTVLIEPLPLFPTAKALLLGVLGIPLCFVLGNYVFRKIPFLGKLL